MYLGNIRRAYAFRSSLCLKTQKDVVQINVLTLKRFQPLKPRIHLIVFFRLRDPVLTPTSEELQIWIEWV